MVLLPFSETNNDQPASQRMADNNFTVLAIRMIFVIKNHGKWISKNRGGLIKRDAMLSEVTLCLDRVPLKLNSHYILPQTLKE
jgi:hypothetical protein